VSQGGVESSWPAVPNGPESQRENLRFRDEHRSEYSSTEKGDMAGGGQNPTADTRIFSPEMVPRLCITIGHQLNEFLGESR